MLKGYNYPYATGVNNVLTVISSEEGSDKIIVNQYSKWGKNSYLAVNVKEDMSDIPNNSFVDGKIIDVKQIEDNRAEITLDKPLEKALEKGTKVRIHGVSGGYLYTNRRELKPGEEFVFASEIKKDEKFFYYSSAAFSKGVSYVIPIILSYSTVSGKDNTVLISDFSISY